MSQRTKKSIFEKLLGIGENSDASVILKIAKEIFDDDLQKLLDDKVLIHFRNLKEIEVVDGDNGDIVEIQRRDGKNMYFSPADGWIAVMDEDIALYKINFDWLLRQVMNALDIADRHMPREILQGNVWALGQHRIEKQNINLIVVRNIKKNIVFDALISHLNNHHKARNPSLVITLDQRLPDYLNLPNQNELLKIGEAIKWDKDYFELNTVLLSGKMGGATSTPGFSNSYRTLVSNGVSYKFTKKQAEALEYLDKGNKLFNQDEVLAEINSTQSKLLQVFRSKGKKHPAWGVIIKGDGNGNYWLDY